MEDITTMLPTMDSTAANLTSQATQFSALFSWADYLVFSMMLAASAGIGIYYGVKSMNKEDDTTEFLLAGKSMTTFPISMSLIASFMSAITLLGTPSEVFINGFVYWLIGFSYFLVMPSAAYLYLPVFWQLNVTSAYEYLEYRFSPAVRRLGSAVFILQMTLYMAIVVFAPSLALAQVTGINLYLSICLICFVCMFYTTLGGMKAVLWTDTLQVLIMYTTMVGIIIYGTIDVGGFNYVWEKATESNRADLIDWDPSPLKRHTVWTLIIGGYFTWITIYGCNQAQVQRYLCVKKLYMARRALWVNLFGLFTLMMICAYGGLVIHAKYHDCDPITASKNDAIPMKPDQLFPLFVMDTMGKFKGLPGLFVAGIFSGALSTVSSGMNSLAAIVLEDFIKGCWFPKITERQATLTSKFLSLFFGLLTFGMVFIAQSLGNVLSAALSIFGMVGGPLLGMFTLGMFFPWSNAIGCFIGTVVSLLFMFFIGVGANVARLYQYIPSNPLPVSVAGCDNFFFNATLKAPGPVLDGSHFLEMDLFKLSYMWYSATGCFTVIIVGLIVSFITGKQDVRKLNPMTLSPAIHWFKRFIPGLDGLGEQFEETKRLTMLNLKKSEQQNEKENYGFDSPEPVNGISDYRTEESSKL